MTAEAAVFAADAALIEWMVDIEKRLEAITKDLGRLREQVDQAQHQGGI